MFLLILSMALCASLKSQAQEYSEEQRLQGFAEHNRKKAVADKEREAGAGEVKKKREEWEKSLAASVGEYKAWKAQQAKGVDESSPEYRQDQEFKKRQARELEEARRQYIKERNAKLARRKSNVKLTEEEELGLENSVNRVADRDRALNGGKPGSSRTSGRPSFNNGSADFGEAPQFNSPPPPPPPTPEFYESEVPPPPPPPPDFEEPIPPPVFDEPGDF